MKIVAISGYFDPLHVGHLEYIKLAKKFGDKLYFKYEKIYNFYYNYYYYCNFNINL